jgi:putative chitinase
MVDQGSCVWVTVPGTDVHLQIREGEPAKILGAFVADWNAYIEPVRDADSACWTATNSVASSNHLSGTACDVCWNSHPFRVANAGFNTAQLDTMNEMLDYYEDLVFWGNNWTAPKDAMHVQLNGDTYGAENFARVEDFIRRKIRADGFSTFRRGGTSPPPPPPVNNAADVLARATGITLAKAIAILPQVSFALSKAQCNNPRRIAAALAQWVIESGHFVYTEEIADGPENEERWKYKGRTWVQLTWLENYSGFSKWCHSLGLVPSPDYFVVRPRELAEQKWAALGPAYWWAVKYPRINEYADRGDIDNVSKWVNAPAWVDNPNRHANGEKERRDAYNRALALGDQLLVLTSAQPPTPGDDDMAQVPQDQWDRVYRELTQKLPSRSPLRHLGEGLVDTMAGFVLNTDGSVHVEVVRLLAGYGHPPTLALLREVAGADPVQYPDRQDDAKMAQAILADVTAAPAGNITVNNMRAEPAAAVAPQVVYLPAPIPEPAPQPEPVAVTPSSTGQIIGQAYDALESLRLADALPVEGRAPLAALIAVLQTKNGSQL